MGKFIFCSNCGKSYNAMSHDKCPFCGTSWRTDTDEGNEEHPNKEKATLEQCKKPERSGWHAFATTIIILSAIGLIILGIVSISEKNSMFFLIGLGEFIMVSIICAIVQLLADIKLRINIMLTKLK
jgi:hypothetical protein